MICMPRVIFFVRRWVANYFAKPLVIAGFFVLVALLWTFLLQHVIAYPFVFLFFGAIMGAAWFGGFMAGVWATVLSSALIAFFFIPPLYSFAIARELRSYEAAFIACAIAITFVSAARRRIENAVRAARDELEVRVRERTAELEQTNRETLERERQLRLLTEAIPQQIWRADSSGQIDYCNRDLTEFAGAAEGELSGEGLWAILHPDDAPAFHQAWKAAREQCVQFESQARVRNAQGSYRQFLIRGIPQQTAEGKIACWYGLHIDIEEQYRAQQQLQAAQGESARWSRQFSMAEMAGSIAHELKQPLTALVTQAQACRRWLHADPPNHQKAANAAESLVRESARAAAVVDRIRSLFNSGHLLRESVDLNRLIVELEPLVRDEAHRQAISVRLELQEELPRVEADAVQIRQLLLNLTTNAIESMSGSRRSAELLLRTCLDPAGRLMVTVQDTGAGLSPQVREKMFEPFFSTKHRGSGIGLSICRSIVEAHGGRIWAESLPGGTAFHFVLGSGA